MNEETRAIYRLQAVVYKLLSNPRRIELLNILAGNAKTFGELRHETNVNANVLTVNLKRLMDYGLVLKNKGLYEISKSGQFVLNTTSTELKDLVELAKKISKYKSN